MSMMLRRLGSSVCLGHMSRARSTAVSCWIRVKQATPLTPDPISQCQQPSTPIAQQLLDGVRYLDVRLRVVGDELLSALPL